MERIVLEIDSLSARKWEQASYDKKIRLSKSISQIIARSLNERDDDFWSFIDRISEKAASNGLTEEKLDQLLNED